jgi:hypothetical protein
MKTSIRFPDSTMTTSLSFVSAPASSAKWWPDLYLRKGRTLQLITPEQCPVVRERFNAGRGASEIRGEMALHDEAGARIGYVSYNGRVWLHDIEGDVEVPVAGVATCEQLDAEGWR